MSDKPPVKEEIVYKGAFYSFKILNIETKEGKPYKYECIEKAFFNPKGGVEIIPIIRKGNKRYLVVIRNFRHPVNAWVLEFPGGIIEGKEPIEHAIFRELEEETGFKLKSILSIQTGLQVDPWKSNDVS